MNQTTQVTTMHKAMTHKIGPELARVHCPMCTHNVAAEIRHQARHAEVLPGQKCPRCSGSLDAAYILQISRAA